jgi:hypothetical protein
MERNNNNSDELESTHFLEVSWAKNISDFSSLNVIFLSLVFESPLQYISMFRLKWVHHISSITHYSPPISCVASVFLSLCNRMKL